MELNKIYNMDCLDGLKQLEDNSIDLVLTDPPYLIENTNAGGKSKLSKSIQNMNNEIKAANIVSGFDFDILKELVRVMKKINIYIWCNHKQIIDYLNFFVTQHGCSFDIIIWNKTNAIPLFSNKYLTDKEYCLYFRRGGLCNPATYNDAKTVYRQPINIKDKKEFNHPTIKPLNIIRNLINNSSNKEDLVLDPFMGSGTTAVACKELGRKYIGFELEKKYCDIAAERLNKVNNKKINEWF